jgi:oxygen-independent coproporphyrinogen-3 oxidase
LDHALWKDAYLVELDAYASLLPQREVTTIYFGGGTPSLMEPDLIAAILNKIAALWRVQHNCEITLEANPSSSEIEKFKAFRKAGVNRISLGVQAFNDADLAFLGRAHDVHAAREAIDMARKLFDRFSFDLIYGRKAQTVAAWTQELQHALQYGAQHMSLYQLTIEEGTPFYKRSKSEALVPADEIAAEMFEITQDIMGCAGLPAYEVSNHATAGQESRHNLVYWYYQDYIGIGPGAHGRFVQGGQRVATANLRKPEGWLQKVQAEGRGLDLCEVLDQRTAQTEALMMGLRLTVGLDMPDWTEKFGQPLVGGLISRHAVQRLEDEDMVAFQDNNLRVTARGMQRLNAVTDYLLSAD